MSKERLLISFSGGRTSAYMTWWLMNNMQHKYEIFIVFANTGKEREETLEFVNECSINFGWNITWIECITNPVFGKGVKAKIVDFASANRNGQPFEDVIRKHGMPGLKHPHCSREMKGRTIQAFAKDIGWKDYYTAIGIRVDEVDRMNENRKAERIIYPLISLIPTRREEVNRFWMEQSFNLRLKGYEGNCDCCWKKSVRKLITLAKEKPEAFQWWKNMEIKYENYTPESRAHNASPPYRFYRDNLSVDEILRLSQEPFEPAKDDSKDTIYQSTMFQDYELDVSNGCEESCEAF